MKPEEGAILDAFGEAFQAIDLLIERQLIQSALVLLYSTLDAAAWLDVSGDGDVTQKGFCSWADRYLLADSELPCTSLELYAARCGMVHSLTAFSKLSREGRVRTLGYAHGPASAKDLNEVAAILGRKDMIGIHVQSLRDALLRGMQRFLDDASTDSRRWDNVTRRSKRLFSNLPRVRVTNALNVLKAKGEPPRRQ
jgi:hypothetical protein